MWAGDPDDEDEDLDDLDPTDIAALINFKCPSKSRHQKKHSSQI